jgi:beta-lactamase regulating signal transducer with metallopeptidase domain
VLAQKAAWGLVLAGAMLMPVLTPWAEKQAWLPAKAKLVLPTQSWFQSAIAPLEALNAPASTTAVDHLASVSATHIVASGLAPVPTDETIMPAFNSSPADHFPSPSISHSDSSGITRDQSAPSSKPAHLLSFATVAWLLYAGVCTALILRLLYGLGAALELWCNAQPVIIESAPALAAGLRLRSSRAVSSPVTLGSGILLPADYDEWNAEKLRVVLAHEQSHVRQRDFYLQLLAGLYVALFWFSPLGWWLKRKLSDLSEAISDRAGLEEAASRASYAQILLEFAALPRTTQIGVAMARTGSISHRIERLLNENLFCQAFAGSRRRLWASLLLVPAILFAAAALIRVEAAQTLQQPAASVERVIGQSQPPRAPEAPAPVPSVTPLSAVAAQAPAAPPPVPASPPTESVPPTEPPAALAPAEAPAALPAEAREETVSSSAVISDGSSSISVSNSHSGKGTNYARGFGRGKNGQAYAYSYATNGDSYAVVSGKDQQNIQFSGEWHTGRGSDIEKARQKVHGDFLWFKHDGKSYVVDDPQVVAQIQAIYKPMEDLGRQQEELGRKQEALGRQQEELGRRQEQASVPTPDISKEMGDLNAAMAKLQAKKGSTVTQEELADLEGKLGELQGRLGSLQGEMGSKQGEFGRQQGELGAKQGELGSQQGRLGAEQGRLAREADAKVKSIIDESMKNGKAKPLQ